MKRQLNMEEISDGKRYLANDLVKADCRGCEGCSYCCRGMGQSILLDPYDIYEFKRHGGYGFQELLGKILELHVVDGLILPNLKMTPQGDQCPFLDGDGRCLIHEYRPGFCRLFPLGRIYEGDRFYYFLQTQECPKKDRSKVKVKKWLGVPEFGRYEQFVMDWHRVLKGMQKEVEECPGEEEAKGICMGLLERFYLSPYDGGREFYEQFYERCEGYAGEQAGRIRHSDSLTGSC